MTKPFTDPLVPSLISLGVMFANPPPGTPNIAGINFDANGVPINFQNLSGNAQGIPGGGSLSGFFNTSALLMGDSWQSQGWQTSGTSFQALANGWANHLQWRLNNSFVIRDNIAVIGKRMDEVVNEQLPTAVASASSYVLLATAGTNDVAFGRTAAQIIASLQQIFSALSAAGKTIIATTIPPRGSTSFPGIAFTVGQLPVVFAVNTWLLETATMLYPRLGVMDLSRCMLDTSSIANADSFYMIDTYTVDGLHPNSLGAITIATEGLSLATRLFKPLIRIAPGASNGAAGDLRNAYRNAFFIQGAGGTVGAGATGTCPQYWGVGRSSGGSNTIVGACSIEARSASFADSGVGNVLRCDLSLAGSVNDRFTVYPVPIDIVPAAGDVWHFEQDVDVNMSSGTIVEIGAGASVQGGVAISLTAGYNVTTASWGVSTYRGTMRSRDVTIQTGATGFAFQNDIRTSAGAVGTVRFGYPRLVKATPPN